jgi:hypothetical protein
VQENQKELEFGAKKTENLLDCIKEDGLELKGTRKAQ